jgi:hypothetical protein
MSSPIAASGDASAATFMTIDLSSTTQKVQATSKIEAAKLAEHLSTQAAAPPQNGRGRIVDTFA